MFPDFERIGAVLREVAAEEAMPRFRALADEDVRRKAAGDLVTVADIAVERQLERRLPDFLPGSLVVGEEAVEDDPTVLDRLEGDRHVWIIDPIDGTGNFARGSATFAVMVALTRGTETLGGWIYDPVGQRMLIAERGEGAYLNGERLRATRGKAVTALQGTLHFGSTTDPQVARALSRNESKVGRLKSLRCAGQEYLRLTTGDSDFALFTKTKPWDHCPGVLILEETGGQGRLLNGRPYTARDYRAPGLLLAADAAHWDALQTTLLGD
ncbi:inositol monophosphatase family protein [Aquibaculum arenosum]|uniref:Inositol monophosphatase n=1 Tax=Aquibaculum arenosum TaxID=3032591 RepID=A0ABT5YMQ5_9PROT|nr:inositol monophosphatase [Fodinicurvata sp. CAU 1616]MDF2096188.1 inositol monophosphatase [Fodinicurvata sp. CAU 1616]